MSKQDRQGVRTARDIEQKYDLGRLKTAQGSDAQDIQFSQLTQTVNQFMADTKAKFEEIASTELISPTIDVTEIEGGHRVTVTDAEGVESFDVLNGTDGQGGTTGDFDINEQAPTYTVAETEAELASGEKISVAFGKISKAVASFINHLANKNNPHAVTYSQLGTTVINKGEDFDTFLTPGKYVGATTIGNGTTANYLNAPTVQNAAFLLEVLPTGSGNQIMQRLTLCSKGYSRKFERHYHSGSFGSWYCTYADANTVLASPGWFMNASQTVTLSEAISKQPNGIVLVFSRYNSGSENDNFNTFFVSKREVAQHGSCGHTFTMFRSASNPFEEACVKYLYISDTTITGHAQNAATGTGSCGITYNNARFVLRYVIGV